MQIIISFLFLCGIYHLYIWFSLPNSFCRTCPSYRSSARSFTMILSPTRTSFIQSIKTYKRRKKTLNTYNYHLLHTSKVICVIIYEFPFWIYSTNVQKDILTRKKDFGTRLTYTVCAVCVFCYSLQMYSSLVQPSELLLSCHFTDFQCNLGKKSFSWVTQWLCEFLKSD